MLEENRAMNPERHQDSHLDPSFPIVVRKLVFASTSPFPPGGCFQLICVTRGGLYRRQGEEFQPMGRIIVVPSPMEQALVAKRGTEVIQVCFDKAFLDQLSIGLWDGTTLMRIFSGGSIRSPAPVSHFPEDRRFAELLALFESVLRECSEKSADYRQMIRLKVLEILLLLERISKNRGTRERDGPDAPMESPPAQIGETASVAQMRDYIQENYTENFSLQEMARSCGLNSSYFSRAFRETVGVPPFEFINRIRVQKACLLLKRTEMTILEIALSVGYNNISFFNRYFRKIMKMSPREYRSYATG